MRTPSPTITAAFVAAAMTLPVLPAGASHADETDVAIAARLDAALRVRADLAVGLDRDDHALLRRVRRLVDRLRDRVAERPTDRPPSDRPVTDVPPTGIAPPTDRPVTDRPVTDRPDDEASHREETFEVGEVGAVTLAWNQHGIRIVNVRAAEGWRSGVLKHERRAVAIGFRNTEFQVVFWARLTPDGLKHGIERRRIDERPDVQTYEAGPAGTVGIAVTDAGLRLAGIRENEGWVSRHEAEPRRIHVVFVDREARHRVDFTAVLTESGEVRTHVEESRLDDGEPTTRPSDGTDSDTAGTDR